LQMEPIFFPFFFLLSFLKYFFYMLNNLYTYKKYTDSQ
jgi:hypothetical protein